MLLLSLEAGQTSLEAAASTQTHAQTPTQARPVATKTDAKPARHAPSHGTQASLFGN
jgi:methylated-DNA-[protein]-cysteine S-methyltransferase